MAEQAKKEMKHILELSKAERRLFLHSFDTLMSDCDGVLWNFTGPIPGVDKALQLLRTDGKKLAFISNNGMRTMEEYQKKFHSLGIDALEEEIVHPALTTVHYLKSIRMRDAVYCIGTEVFKDYLRKAGFKVLDGVREKRNAKSSPTRSNRLSAPPTFSPRNGSRIAARQIRCACTAITLSSTARRSVPW